MRLMWLVTIMLALSSASWWRCLPQWAYQGQRWRRTSPVSASIPSKSEQRSRQGCHRSTSWVLVDLACMPQP